jgi:hypothetical protein
MTRSSKVDDYIAQQPAWQQKNLTQFRDAIHKAYPEIIEEIKWNVPVFMVKNKMVFAMSAFKQHTKYNFIANGAVLPDGSLFNNGFDSKTARAIDLREGEIVDLGALSKIINDSIQLTV